MKNLTIKKAVEGNFNGLQKYANKTTKIKGENVFFYLPATFLTTSLYWTNISSNNNDLSYYCPLESRAVNPNKNFKGNVSILMRVKDTKNRVLSTTNYNEIPIGSPIFNTSFLIPFSTYEGNKYFGFTALFPNISTDIIIEIKESWILNFNYYPYPFKWTRNIKIPVHPNDIIIPHYLKVEKNYNSFFWTNLDYSQEFNSEILSDRYAKNRVRRIFSDFMNMEYEFLDLYSDETFLEFGKQSILMGYHPFIKDVLVGNDFQSLIPSGEAKDMNLKEKTISQAKLKTPKMQLFNEQPNLTGYHITYPFSSNEEYSEVLDKVFRKKNNSIFRKIFKKENNSEQFIHKDILENRTELSGWFKARFNLFKMSGKQFISVDKDNINENLELIFPMFSVNKV
ncbi:MAG: hypothetical protein HDS11_02785 [Bacteroides sp.]|nr:hypothetical protein [Bacteroides sp.]